MCLDKKEKASRINLTSFFANLLEATRSKG